MSKTYYRALYSPEHLAEWLEQKYNSHHSFMPHEWINKYYKENCRDENEYPLDTSLGKFVIEGVRNFLTLAPKYKINSKWNLQDSLNSCVLDGVCAFENRKSLLDFISKNPYPNLKVVVFEGNYVSKIPESTGGTGVLVKPLNQGHIYTIDEFREME